MYSLRGVIAFLSLLASCAGTIAAAGLPGAASWNLNLEL